MTHSFHTCPRLYTSHTLVEGQTILLPDDQAHYLKNVLRQGEGDSVRLFQERDGEWLAILSFPAKKSVAATLQTCLRPANPTHPEIHLFFSPIKKDRQDILVEKAVELGVTHLHPVVFARSIVRDIKSERVRSQLIEAAEQCERLDVPDMLPVMDLKKSLSLWNPAWPLFAAIERQESSQPLSHYAMSAEKPSVCGYMVGPEGGITPEEVAYIGKFDFIRPVSLGPRILRAETAVFYGVSILSS